MKIIYLYPLMVLASMVVGAEIAFTERPDWQQPVLKKVEFDATVVGIDQIVGEEASVAGDKWVGFVVFSCTAKENLGKRILWVSAEVTFSNGYKRDFENVSFFIIEKGDQFDLKKIPFESDKPVTVKSVLITSIVMK